MHQIYSYGLSVKEVRKLAYDYAASVDTTNPPSWETNKFAGPDWFSDDP